MVLYNYLYLIVNQSNFQKSFTSALLHYGTKLTWKYKVSRYHSFSCIYVKQSTRTSYLNCVD